MDYLAKIIQCTEYAQRVTPLTKLDGIRLKDLKQTFASIRSFMNPHALILPLPPYPKMISNVLFPVTTLEKLIETHIELMNCLFPTYTPKYVRFIDYPVANIVIEEHAYPAVYAWDRKNGLITKSKPRSQIPEFAERFFEPPENWQQKVESFLIKLPTFLADQVTIYFVKDHNDNLMPVHVSNGFL